MEKYDLKKQTGAISVFVMMAMLFFLLTILGIYLISTRRAQAQTEAFKIAKERYYSEDSANMYNDKIAQPNEIIPIYTKEQLWSIGEPKKIEIEGKVYNFSESDTSKYELKNDIVINIPDSETLTIVNEGNIKKNQYEIYYYHNGNYYIPANGAMADLSINGNDFVYKDNLNQNLGYVTDGLLLHYDGIKNTGTGHADNATTWKDLSGNGNDGQLNGSTWEQNSLNFDGIDDFVNVSESSTISPQNQTIEVVLKCNGPSKETSADKRQIFFVKWVGYTMELNADNTITYGRSATTTYLQSKNKLNYGTIANITATSGNNISTLYFNNVQENQAQTVPAAYAGMNNISIGNYSNGRHFNGNIYAIRMYDRVLTEEERAKNYEIDKKRFNIQEANYVTDGLLLHYDGINNTGTGHTDNVTTWKDLSGNGNDGILTGFNHTEESGWKTNGLKFDGVDDIVKTNGKFDFSTLKTGTPFTYGVTVSVKDVSQNWYGIMTNMTAWGQGGFNIQYGSAQRIALGMGQYLNSTTVPIANTVYQIYGVYDGSIMNLYVNGKLENSMTYSIGAGSKTMTFGWFYDTPSLPTNGEILNVKIYNKALTSEEIKTNYETDKTRFNIQ